MAMTFGVAGCRRSEIIPGVTDSQFVATLADLRRIDATVQLDSASRAAARTRILQQRGLTVERLDSAARALAGDPERASAIFRAVEQRAVNLPPAPDSVRRGPNG
jgi:hypothetical protein